MWVIILQLDLTFAELLRSNSILCLGIFIGPFFKKTLADSNAPVQEKALDALIAFLKAADADAAR